MTSQSEGKSTAAMPPIKRRYLPSLGAFATFEVAAKHLSFTLAAKELNVTQGAVSQQIRLLERALDKALFVRKHNALELTPEGVSLFSAVTAGLDTISAAVSVLTEDQGPQAVTVSATDGMALFWLQPMIDSFRVQHPEVGFVVLASDADDTLRNPTSQPWWPWAVAGAGVLLVIIGVRWLLTHTPAAKTKPLPLHDADDRGTITVDLTAVVDAAAYALAQRPDVRSAKGKAVIDRGTRTLDLTVSVAAEENLSELTDAIDAVCADLARATGDPTLATRTTVRIDTSAGAARRVA